MLKVPYFDDAGREGDTVFKAIIKNKTLLITDEAIETFGFRDKSYIATKGTNEDIFLFKKDNFKVFMEELFKPEYRENARLRKVIRHFAVSANEVIFNVDESNICLGELPDDLEWPRNCEVLMIYNKNMICEPISIRYHNILI